MKASDRHSKHIATERRDAADGPVGRFLTGRGEKAVMGIVAALALMVLARMTSLPTQRVRQDETDNRPGGGIIIRSEVLCLWLPEPLHELAKRPSQSPVPRSHEEFQRFLERDHQEDLWYALTIRGHQANGDFADLTFIRHPYTDSQHFQELLALVDTMAGNPPRHPTTDLSTASVHVIQRESWRREPRDVLAGLEYCPPVSVAHEGAR